MERGDREYRVVVCRGPDCMDRGSAAVHRAFADALGRQGLEDRVLLLEYACFGACHEGPNVVVGPSRERSDFLVELFGEAQYFAGEEGEFLYSAVTPADAEAIVVEHLIGGRPLQRLLREERR